MGKNKKIFLPISILITNLLVILISLWLSNILDFKESSMNKVYELTFAITFASLSFVGLLLVDVYKRSVSKVWYWIFAIGFGALSLYASGNFITIYLKYVDSIVNKLYFIYNIIQSVLVSNCNNLLEIFALSVFLPIALTFIIIMLSKLELPKIRLIIYVRKYVSNKLYTPTYNKNVSLGFLYNTIP